MIFKNNKSFYTCFLSVFKIFLLAADVRKNSPLGSFYVFKRLFKAYLVKCDKLACVLFLGGTFACKRLCYLAYIDTKARCGNISAEFTESATVRNAINETAIFLIFLFYFIILLKNLNLVMNLNNAG